ncbi:NAD-dependent epimerase/dehydratase family protein [Wenyingzhuangia aestuarii]|uniref:NAD-dependent epimerase/dehydratase family protein n=1 Tax=Wenyingzhuangia aestuarii TaxID=1647582 RepID=UPI00143B031E|nr:NAD-dependent epimerase/dehydratase family protein [Wenyingzhuangia aestuarii]NJB82330.1 nucleoside-diphosphate-sugar epimerase [Wenyingzhuangia aestuarii]
MILVTGGTGLVGAHLLYNLCKTNSQIVAIYRNKETQNTTKEIFELYGDTSNYQNIIWKKADIVNIPEIELVFNGITHVYHAAAKVSFDSKDSEQLRKVNVEGTANIVNLCIKNNIEKLCYVSSIATLAKTPGVNFIDEDCEWNPEGDHSDYSLTKYGAEMEVWRASQEGVPVVIVNPGVIFGFGAWNVNSSQLFKKIKKGLSFYTNGTVGVVAVQDVVNAMILLMNSNISNQRFVLVAQNSNYKAIFSLIAQHLNVTPPKFKAGKTVTEIAWRLNSLIATLTFGTLDFGLNKYSARAAHKKRYYNGNNIKKSITNFSYTPFDMVIKEICSKLS